MRYIHETSSVVVGHATTTVLRNKPLANTDNNRNEQTIEPTSLLETERRSFQSNTNTRVIFTTEEKVLDISKSKWKLFETIDTLPNKSEQLIDKNETIRQLQSL